MRAITVIAIAAAIAAGAVATAILFYVPVSRTVGQPPEVPAANNEYRQVIVTVNGFKLLADVAETGEQKTKGLSVKDSLQENEGMLFVFDREAPHSFWMMGMKFPIDIIWLDSNKQVVHIEHSLEPCGSASCPTFSPDANSLYVLETVAGFADRHSVAEGTQVEFLLDA